MAAIPNIKFSLVYFATPHSHTPPLFFFFEKRIVSVVPTRPPFIITRSFLLLLRPDSILLQLLCIPIFYMYVFILSINSFF
ncbi:hypothetical protein BCR42DRAFT_415312, partial [Absidia repens]